MLFTTEESLSPCAVLASAQDDSGTKAVLIVSEKLTDREEDWLPVPQNHFISVNRNLEVHLSPRKH